MSQRYRVELSQVHVITINVEAESAQEASEHAQQGGGETVDVWQEEPRIKRIEKLSGVVA